MNSLGLVAGSKSKDNPFRATPRPVDPAIYDPNAKGQNWTVLDVANVYSRGTREGVYADIYQFEGINDAGFAVGKKSKYGVTGSSAFITTPEFQSVEFLPIPNGGFATAINNLNHVVGATLSNTSAEEYSYAFFYDYDGDILTNLGTLPSNGPGSEPGLTSYAYDINDSEQVVGSSWLETVLTSLNDPEKYHAFIWENGQMTDLNELIQPGTDWILTRATAINEKGDIVGIALVNGIEHGFLLSTSQPSTENQPPVAIASADVTSGKAPLTVNFTGGESYDLEGAISYVWGFGDGSSSSLVANPSHDYLERGIFKARLTVTDEQGLTNSAEVKIKIRGGRM